MPLSFTVSTKLRQNSDLSVIFINKADIAPAKKRQVKKLLSLEISELAFDQLIKRGFKATHGETQLLSNAKGQDFLVMGFEHNKDDNKREVINRYRQLGHTILSQAKKLSAKVVTIQLDTIWSGESNQLAALLEGFYLSDYEYLSYKTGKSKRMSNVAITLSSSHKIDKELLLDAKAISAEVCFARDLINTPPNDLLPSKLAKICQVNGRKAKLSVSILDAAKLKRMGAGGIACVGMGSSDSFFLAKLHYKPRSRKAKKRIALVGKSVTFDTGGYCLKNSMDTMKCDMSGGAAVLATMKLLAQLKLPIEVTAYIPIVENMVSGAAVRPGDIFTLLNGKTVEVLNTDAEGRLILADALHLAQKEKPDLIIDLATLTGACAVALGSKYAGLFCNNENLAKDLQHAGDLAGEALWRMPLANEYRKLITSQVADYKNLFKEAGAITAALFLEEFVNKTPWAHLDIAATAFTAADEGYIKAGGVGFGVRTLVQYLKDISSK